MRKYTLYAYVVIISLTFLLRAILFAENFGALEHDSGWFAGVARNLAERGIYASYTNTIKEEGNGAHPSIHGRYSVQDENGYSYFPAGVTAGAGYVVPQALVFKLFGFGFWQLRAWPLAAFFGMLILIFLLTFNLGGIIALFLLQIWMWAIPQVYITFSYEAYGEHIALLYLFISFYILWKSYSTKERNLKMFASGIFFSLAILTKYLVFLAGVGFAAFFLYDIYKNKFRQKKSIKKIIINWACFILGVFLPIVSFELYRYIYLTPFFGKSAWQATNLDFLLHFKSNGSGTGLKNIDWSFVVKKLTIWKKMGIDYFSPWILLVVSPFLFLKRRSNREKILFALIFISSLSILLWYLLLSPTGWARHAWLGLIPAMIIICSVLGKFVFLNKRYRYLSLLLLILLSGLIIIEGKGFAFNLLLNQRNIDAWRISRYEGGLQGFPHTDTFSLADQKELIYFFNQNVKDEDRVYYLGWFLVAEGSTLVNKVFYSLDRYLSLGQAEGPDSGKSYLIIGPYQKGIYSLVPKSYYPLKLTQLCKDVVFENPSYTLCTLKNNLVYENRAYD